MDNNIYKIKDSVDLFLTDNKVLTTYYMNTRQKKEFVLNEEMIRLIEMIDGIATEKEIVDSMRINYDINSVSTEKIFDLLLSNKIITKVIDLSEVIPSYDIIRYDRQLNYFSEFLQSEKNAFLVQKKLMESRILILGCGAIGGNIALELAMSGVQNITLFDYDVVEESDISRHMYFNENHIGMEKTESLKNAIEEIDKRIKVKIINKSLKPNTDIEELIKKHDFVVNTLDEPYIGYTAAKISRICVENNIPHFIGGGFDAHLASTGELIIPYITPCVECYANHFKVSLKNWNPEKHPVKIRITNIGGLASMSLFSSSFACIEIIKAITGIVDIPNEYKIRGELLFNDMSLTYLNVKKNEKCPVCGKRGDF